MASDLKVRDMKNIFLYFILCFLGLSCHKEEPFDFSYKANPAREDVFRHIKFDCQEVNGPSSFVGKVGGQSYCLYDTNRTDAFNGIITVISSSEPVINPNGDTNALCSGFNFRFVPKEYKAGNFTFNFSYYSNNLDAVNKEDFLKINFIPGEKLTLSKFYTTSPPNVEEIQGAEISLVVYDGFPDTRRGIPFTTSDIVQSDDAYVKCIRSERIDAFYYIELDVNLMLPSRSRFDGLPEPEMKNIQGRLVMQVEL